MIEAVGSFASLLALGFVLGMRHATDADHVIAIATIVSRQRSLRGSAMIGAAWGIGHTFTILVVGGAIIVFNIAIPPRVGLSMEFAVGVMLMILGVLTLTGLGGVLTSAAGFHHVHSAGAADRAHVHAHGDYIHRHATTPDHGHSETANALAFLDLNLRGVVLYRYARPLVVGVVHGLAGSAAIALLVLPAVRDPVWAMTYLVLFGAGTIAGMMLITVALAAPFALTAAKLPRFNLQLRAASGLISFAFGLVLIYQIGFLDGGLFSDDPAFTPH
jgi:high-affinity nickel-transport protein